MAHFSTLEIKHFFRTGCHNIHVKDNDGNTPLHESAKTGNLHVIKSILEYGAPVDAINNKGETPLHVATLEKNFESMKLLLHAGSDPNAQDKNQCTPLHYFLECYDHTQWNKTQDKQKILGMVQEMLHCGASTTIQNADGRTLLHLAVQCQQPDLVVMIMEDAKKKDIKEDKLRAKCLLGGVALFAVFLGVLAKLKHPITIGWKTF